MTNGERTPVVLHQTILKSPSRLAPLFLLAVPKHEVSNGDGSLSEIILSLFRSAGPVMTQERWRELWERINRRNIWQALTDFPIFWGSRLYPEFYPKWARELEQLRQAIQNAAEPNRFTRLLIEGLLSVPAEPLQPLVFAHKSRAKHVLLIYPPSALMSLYWLLYLDRQELEVSEEELVTWIWLTSVLTRKKERTVQEAMNSFLDCDIPFALSKESDKAKLETIISQARIVAYVPFASAATEATHLITQGQYIAALEVTLVSGAVTLILVATFSLAEALLERIHRK